MKILIPEIKSKLNLTQDWSFTISAEDNNYIARKYFDLHDMNFSSDPFIFTLTKDTILTVYNINLKRYLKGYGYVTFRITKADNTLHDYADLDFTARLEDVNNIEFEYLPCNEDTLSLIHKLNLEIKKELSASVHHTFMKLVLNCKTINTIRPKEKPDKFIKKLSTKFEKMRNSTEYSTLNKKENKDIIISILTKYIRAYKLNVFLD